MQVRVDWSPEGNVSEMLETTPEVVAVLVENHRRFLGFLEKRVGSREVAEDILQETFVRGLARAGQLKADESVELAPWEVAIVEEAGR